MGPGRLRLQRRRQLDSVPDKVGRQITFLCTQFVIAKAIKYYHFQNYPTLSSYETSAWPISLGVGAKCLGIAIHMLCLLDYSVRI